MIFTKLNFLLLTLSNKNEILQLLSSKLSLILKDHKDRHENDSIELYTLNTGYFWVLHFSVGESDRGETQFCRNVAKTVSIHN